jgi:thiol-disulfide isomerase/thioredoxin
MDIQQTGVNHFKDSIINALVAQKKISVERNQQLISLKQKYNHLLPGNPAPHLQGVNAEGKLITLKDLKGKVIFIDVWGTGCPPCIEAIPHVMELRNKLQENKEVEFVFLSGDKEDEWKQFLKAHPTFKGTHLRSRGEEDSRYEENWKINGIPRYILIDKQGNIIDAFARNNSYEKLAEMIEKASKK